VLSRQFYREIQVLREAASKSRGDRAVLEQLSEDVKTMVVEEKNEMHDLSVRRLFEASVESGHTVVQDMDPNYRGMSRFRESADVVSTALFAYTMGQIIYTETMKSYAMPEFIGDKLVTKMVTQFSGEKIPGVTEVGDQVEIVGEGAPYPRALIGECFIETPETIKRGLIIDVTKEAIFFDRTNLILKRAGNVGKFIGINREKRILDVVLGIVTLYKRNGAAAVATYGSDNTKTSNALVDWTNVDAVDQLFNAQTDPDTGEPIVITANTVVVPMALKTTAKRILNASMTGQTTSSRETRVDSNSLDHDFNILSNQYVKARSGSDTTWFYGNPKEAFVYAENFPLTVITNTENAHMSFERDIVSQSKASERGAAGIIERKFMAKSTA
jgi:hypothetical protein